MLKRIKRGICEIIEQKISTMAIIGAIVGVLLSILHIITLSTNGSNPLTLQEIYTNFFNLALRIFVMTIFIGTAILLGMTILMLIAGFVNAFTKK